MRKTPALLSAVAAAALVVVSLVGCSSSASASCTPAYASGDSAKLVKVSGALAKEATATFPTPLVAKTSQQSVNSAGHGASIQSGDQVDYGLTAFDARSGQPVGTLGLSGSFVRVAATTQVGGKPSTAFAQSLICAKDNERYTLVATAKAAFGTGILASNGIPDSTVLVLVVYVKDHFLGKANGINQLPQDGMPAVITAVSGQPGIVIQEIDKPRTLRVATIKAGAGPAVKKNATVHIKYTGWTWPATSSDKPVVWPGGTDSSGNQVPDGESTWTKDQAADVKVSPTALPPGFYKALLGAKVGSQVLVVIPPKDGFGASASGFGFTAQDTVIMVIDVLGIA